LLLLLLLLLDLFQESGLGHGGMMPGAVNSNGKYIPTLHRPKPLLLW
jgi:hypothetical protein